MQKIRDALMATQRALLGTVTPELRAVVVDLDNDNDVFYIQFYYDGEVRESLLDLWDCAITEASAGLDGHYFINQKIQRVDYPQVIPDKRGSFAYRRME